mgnify:FL=1|tara:strand:+ start:878 stop:1324 length:447 start_codon:yes stop_codon:yes gene_type:complete
MEIKQVSVGVFKAWLALSRLKSQLIQDNVLTKAELNELSLEACYMHEDYESGYCITEEGEMVCLHTLVRGRGEALVQHAIAHGATSLICYSGGLVEFYERNGFVVEERVDVPLCKEQKIFIMRTLTKEEQLVRYVQAIEDNAVDWMTG